MDSPQTKKPTIFHLDRQRSWTGQISRVFQVARGLHEDDFEVGMVAHPGSQIGARCQEIGIEVITLPMRGFQFWPTVLRLSRRLKGRNIDVLHAHGPRDHLLAMMVCRLAGIPHLLRTKHNHTRLRSGRFSRFAYEQSDRVVTVSEYVRQLLIEDGLQPDHIVAIHDSVDVERFSPRPPPLELAREWGIEPHHVVLGNVSSLHHRKGIDLVLRAFASLRDLSDFENFRCLLIGKRWERWKELIAELGLADKVIVPGFYTEIPDALALFDLYVLPSREEALGTSVVEAMATERPVIVSRVGGLVEAVTPETGVLVESEDVEGLARAMRQLLGNPEHARKLGRAARQRVLEKHSEKVLIKRTIDLYHDILGRSRPQSRATARAAGGV